MAVPQFRVCGNPALHLTQPPLWKCYTFLPFNHVVEEKDVHSDALWGRQLPHHCPFGLGWQS